MLSRMRRIDTKLFLMDQGQNKAKEMVQMTKLLSSAKCFFVCPWIAAAVSRRCLFADGDTTYSLRSDLVNFEADLKNNKDGHFITHWVQFLFNLTLNFILHQR